MSASDVGRALFEPRTIALVGASANEAKYNSLPQRFLRTHGYGGRVFPVNPARSEILGEKAYPDVASIDAQVDHAFIMLPTAAVEAAVADCVAAGVGCVTVLSNGFAESGDEGRAAQARLTGLLAGSRTRLLGPNSLGVLNTHAGVSLSANEVLSLPDLPKGANALVTQSGSMLGALLSRGHARGIGFSKMISVGNEADLGAADLIELLTDDPQTETILLFLETVRDAPAFSRAARRAFDAGKPVLAFLLGRSALGQKLAASHTGSLAGSGAAMEAFLAECGVIRVDQFSTLLEMPPLLRGRRPASRRNVTLMTTTGGGGALVVDALEGKGVDLVAADAIASGNLAAAGIEVGASPLIDLTLAGANAATYGRVLGELLASPSTDLVAAIVGSSAQFRPDRGVQPVVEAQAQHPEKPVAVFLTPHAERSLRLFQEAGVAAFTTPEACADAIRAFLSWRAPLQPAQAPALPEDVTGALSQKRGALTSAEARSVFERLGIEQPRVLVLPPAVEEWDDEALGGIGYPVVAKILSRDIQHKTEVGGVALDIADAGALKAAGRDILASVRIHAPDAYLEGIQVESQEKGLAQALVGYRHDPAVGGTVILGMGGVLTELYRDFTIRMAPVDEAAAREMIAEVSGLSVLRGFRNLPPGDLGALADAVVAMSRLALVPGFNVAEAEINPLLVRGEGKGAVAVDGLILLRE